MPSEEFFPSLVFIFFLYYATSVSLSLPIRRLYWLLIVFATLSVSYCVILQSCDGQSRKMGLILVCPTLQSQSQIGLHLGDTVAEQAQAIITESSELELIPSSTRITKFNS